MGNELFTVVLETDEIITIGFSGKVEVVIRKGPNKYLEVICSVIPALLDPILVLVPLISANIL